MKRGHVIKVDVIKTLIDYNSEEELINAAKKDPTINIYNQMRYSAINCSLAISANCAKNAKWMKSTLGKHAYTIQTAIELFRGRNEYYDLDIDDGSITYKDLDCKFFWIYNGKFGGGGMTLSPFSLINDGFFEMSLGHRPCPLSLSIGFFDDVKNGGTHVYKKFSDNDK